MNPSYEWTESDVLKLINDQVEEHLQLDYKRSASLEKSDPKKKEISKDVSAFANSAGGTILYGVAEGKDANGRSIPLEVDGIDPAQITKEWLEQVINSNIEPPLYGVRINPIPLNSTCPGKVCYAVSVPESHTAHQASDKRYYMRFNFESVAMQDHLVRLVMGKVQHPRVSGRVELVKLQPNNPDTVSISMQFILTNSGRIPAIDVYLELYVPQVLPPGISDFPPKMLRIKTVKGKLHRVYSYYMRDDSGPLPLFPDIEYPIFHGNGPYVRLSLPVSQFQDLQNEELSWVVYADKAEPHKDQITIKQALPC